MDFLDRVGELRRLRALHAAGDGALAVVTGRRRVGKTRLLLEWVRESNGVYWVADESAAPLQRRSLAEAIASVLPSFADVEYPDWQTLLSRFAKDAKSAGFRGPVVLDELPYVVESSRELPSVLQRFVDHELPRARLVLAVAGSSQNMMQGLTLDASAPLYGRAREQLRLSPLPARELLPTLGRHSAPKAVEHWAAWGGIPRYWELASPYRDVLDAIDALVLDPLGPLHEEPARLLLEERPPAVALRPILEAIGAGAHRVSEIAGRIGQPATSLSRPLSRLAELELISRELPFGESERGSKRALYRLRDPFLQLWFGLVAPRRSAFTVGSRNARRSLLLAHWPQLRSMAWEQLCRRSVPAMRAFQRAELGAAARYWAGAGPEWDIVARSIGTRRQEVLVGECKWPASVPTLGEIDGWAHALLAKGLPPPLVGALHVRFALFVPQLPSAARGERHGVELYDAAAVLDTVDD